MYLARDKDGRLFLFQRKPIKGEERWLPDPLDPNFTHIPVKLDEWVDAVKWTQHLPRKVSINITYDKEARKLGQDDVLVVEKEG